MRMLLVLMVFLLSEVDGFALSRPIDRDIEFPKEFDAGQAAAIRKVIRDERYQFVGGIVSYWPPDYGTRLSFQGDAPALNSFLGDLHKLPGIAMRVILYRGRDDETRRDSAWQLDFSKAHPQQLTVYLNLNAKELEWSAVALPEWPPTIAATPK